MKKTIIILCSITICIIVYVTYHYRIYTYDKKQLNLYNNDFEQYCDKDITGTELATILNKAIDSNEKLNVKKNSNNEYDLNDENIIKIDVYFQDVKKIYSMETISKVGVESFVEGFNTEKFRATKKEYNKKNKIKYILFEQQIN